MKQFLFFLLSSGIGFSFSQSKMSQNKLLCTPPTVTMSSNVTICAGDNATISAMGSGTTAPYTYAWSPSGNVACPTCSNTTANPPTTTTYTVLVTDGASCTNTGTVQVTVNPTPTVSIGGGGSICTGGSATLTASGGVTYSWNTSSTNNPIVVTPSVPTTYTVWGTNAHNCTSTATATVSFYPSPTASIGGTLTICNNQSTTLNGSGGVTYSWAPGSQTTTNITVNPTTNTTYTLTVTDANGCTDTEIATVTVNPTPTISISGNNTICSGGNATLTASGGLTYNWLPDGQTTSSITVNPSVPTNYTVIGTNAFGCTNTATTSVNFYTPPVASISGNLTICSGDVTTLTGSGGVTYSWSTGSTNNPITDNPTTNTSYTVIVTDANGCTDDDVATVTVNPLPFANAGPDVSICSGSSITLNATGNGTYLWSPSTGLSCTTCSNPNANPTATITYTVTVTNLCGSISDSVVVTINALPSVNAGSDVTICLNGNVTLNASGSGTYNWSPSAGLSNTTIANPVASPTTSTQYTVTITDVCGTASDSVWVIVNVPLATVSGNSPICVGGSSTLCATGGGSYLWNTGSTNSCITVSPTITTGYTVTITDSFGCTDTDTITVNVNPLPNVNITGNTTICAGINDTLVASGGVTYVWNTGVSNDTLIVSPTVSTGYTVTVTDGNGCSNTANIFVNVNPQPTANAGSDATICLGSSVTLSGTGNGTYLWNPGGQTNSSITVNPTVSTTYTLTVTNSCGTAIDSVIVTVNSLPNAAISGTSTICAGSTDTLMATGGVIYQWNTGSTNDSIFVNPSITTGYTVTVTDSNGCSASATFTVNVSSVTAGITGNNVICSGDSTVLTASGGGTYLWNNGSTTSSITVSPTITNSYTVTVTNSLGCTDTATFNVTVTPQPTASVTANDSTLCSGSSATLTASGGTSYSWSPTTGLNNSNISNPIATITSTITYTVVVSNGFCSDITSITLTVNPLPTVSITPTSTSICQGDSATLSVSGAVSYVWNPGGQTTSLITVYPTTATTYTVIGTDANGCTDAAMVVVNVLSPVNVMVSGDTSICLGDITTLIAQGGGSYVWSPGGQTTSSIVVSPTVNSTYTVIASNGACSDTATITVNTYSLPTAVATASHGAINIGGSSTLTGTTSTGTWNWVPGNSLSCAQCPNPIASPTVTTTYTLCVTDNNGCTACDTVTVLVDQQCGNIFLPNAFSPNNDGVNDFFCLRGPGAKGGGPCTASPCIVEVDFTIYNRWGQKVFHTTDISKGWDGIVNGKKEADPAVFFYIVTYKDAITGKYTTLEGNVSLVK